MNANVTTLGSHQLSVTAPNTVRAVGSLLARWYRRVADRRHLATLDDFMLSDIGVARADVEIEISKPFWRV